MRNASSSLNDDIRGMSRLNQRSSNSCTRRLIHTSIARGTKSSIHGGPTFQTRDTLEYEITFWVCLVGMELATYSSETSSMAVAC